MHVLGWAHEIFTRFSFEAPITHKIEARFKEKLDAYLVSEGVGHFRQAAMTKHLTGLGRVGVDKTVFQPALIHTVKMPVLDSVDTSRIQLYRAFFKRLMDILLVLISAPLVVPLVGFLALLVALNGGQPFYSQLRVGRGGRTFRIWKLRTMVKGSDKRLKDYLDENPEALREWNKMQKLQDDPRITGLGRMLRKSSLDELPQLLNVLCGSMALVGPRPMMPEQKFLYDGTAYFKLRPGITGPWQISDRNTCSFAKRVRYDENYDQDLSFWTDLRILAKTVLVVLRGTGC